MSMTGVNPYSYAPTLAGLVIVILLGLSAVLTGARVPRLTWVSWVSLVIGGYFLVRCLLSESCIEAWREAPLILGCFVFYIAGVYAASNRSPWPLLSILATAVVLNLAALYLMQYTDASQEWLGRPEHALGTAYTRPSTLFAYENIGCTFLMAGGLLLAYAALLHIRNRKWLIVFVPLGLSAILLSVSSNFDARSPYAAACAVLLVFFVCSVVRSIVRDDKIGLSAIVLGFSLITGAGVLLYDLLFGGELLHLISDIDSHGRYELWKQALPLLNESPVRGMGAGTVRWHLLPLSQPGSGRLINYAHNDYLDAWICYGTVGLAGICFILIAHTIQAFRAISGQLTEDARRIRASLALAGLAAWAVCAFTDFQWHQFAAISMSAFCCGLLAAPFPQAPRIQGQSPRAVRTESATGKAGLTLIGLSIMSASAWLTYRLEPAWTAQWEYNRLSQEGSDANGEQRRGILASVIPNYPDSALTDNYLTLPEEQDHDLPAIPLLKEILRDNPRQLLAVDQLGEALSRTGHFEEAELLYRRYYEGDGLMSTAPNVWRNFYATNLLRWGEACLWSGENDKALSLLQYAITITDSYGTHNDALTYRLIGKDWDEITRNRRATSAPWYQFSAACKKDLSILQSAGFVPDDAWQQPMEPGGKPALYRGIIKEAALKEQQKQQQKQQKKKKP